VISVLSNDVLHCWLHGSRYEVTAEWKDLPGSKRCCGKKISR
jgi:hypothetical protein